MIKKKKAFFYCLVSSLFCVILTLLCVCFAKSTNKLATVEGLIDRYFISDEEVNTQLMYDGALRGMVDSLNDPYSEYMSSSEFAAFSSTLENSYVGIGVTIFLDPDDLKMTVLSTAPGSPAEAAGILPDDKLIMLNGTAITEESYNDTLDSFKEPGKELELTVLRGKETFSVALSCAEIDMQTVSEKAFGDVYYIALTMFGEKTPADFKESLEHAKEYKALVLDLRNNGGGLVSSLTEIADELLPSGLLFYTEDKLGNREDVNIENNEYFDKPLAILVNGQTASASEILSGAVKDGNRGLLIGQTTFGKGLVQNTFELFDGSAVKLTCSKYFTPSGAFINGIGITPDVVVENNPDTVITTEPDSDIQLKTALDMLGAEY